MRRWISLAMAMAIAAAAMGSAAAAQDGPVAYRLSPAFEDERLTALAVEVRFDGDADGTTTVLLPDDWGGETDLYRQIEALAVEGATLDRPEPNRLELTHAPGAALVLRYRVRSGYPRPPAEGGGKNPYMPIIAGHWFSVLGHAVFAAPQGETTRPAVFEWGDFPFGWRMASDLESSGLTLEDVSESVAIGGAGLRVLPVGEGVRVAVLGEWAFDEAMFLDRLGRVMAANHALWRDEPEPYLIAMTPLTPEAGSQSLGGTGLGDAFSLYAGTDSADAGLPPLLAHEHLHTWISDRIGGLADEDEALGYWLSEGFTDFYTLRVLLRSGVWSLDQFVADINRRLSAYATSPVRARPNADILSGFWSDPAFGDLPYKRGMALAALWDGRLRADSGGTLDLDDLMLAMRGPKVEGEAAPERLTRVAPTLGLSVADDVVRYIDGGELVTLPADLYGACATVETVQLQGFDAGFDTAALGDEDPTARGVTPDGPAYRAGLREGDVLLGWSIYGGDASRDIDLTVRDTSMPDGRRNIVYRPTGPSLPVQRVVLTAGMTPERRAACSAFMAGDGRAPAA